MEQTTKYQLNQWAGEDRILREDFNADNAKLEQALAEQAAILAGCGNCKIWTTRYTGTGTFGNDNPTKIKFPHKPALFFILQGKSLFVSAGDRDSVWVSTTVTNSPVIITTALSWAGTEASMVSTHSTYGANYQANSNNATYLVVAFYQEA